MVEDDRVLAFERDTVALHDHAAERAVLFGTVPEVEGIERMRVSPARVDRGDTAERQGFQAHPG